MTPRLKAQYDAEVAANLKDQLGLANIMQVPRLQKIVVNMGVGDAAQCDRHGALRRRRGDLAAPLRGERELHPQILRSLPPLHL